jgi:hypothetical protein
MRTGLYQNGRQKSKFKFRTGGIYYTSYRENIRHCIAIGGIENDVLGAKPVVRVERDIRVVVLFR